MDEYAVLRGKYSSVIRWLEDDEMYISYASGRLADMIELAETLNSIPKEGALDHDGIIYPFKVPHTDKWNETRN